MERTYACSSSRIFQPGMMILRGGRLSGPLFSIVIACYNQEGFVKQAVDSALAQTTQSKEIIVVDDGSKDRTPEILREYGNSIVFIAVTENGGALAARNRGASVATGKYLVFLDGDDVLMPWALDVYQRLIESRSPTILFGKCELFSGKIPEAETSDPCDIEFVDYLNFLSKDRPCIFNTSTLVVERAAFWSAGGWSPSIFYQDIQDLLTKMEVAGRTILLLGPDTVWYRMHTTNAVRKVSPFVAGIYTLLAKANSGAYPGGRKHRLERSSWFGGLIFYWMKVAFQNGLYRDGFGLLATGWWMILLAIVRRGTAWMAGRKPVEVLPLQHV